MRLLLDESKRGRVQILLPSIVLQETVRHFTEECASLQRSLGQQERSLHRLGLNNKALEPIRNGLERKIIHYQAHLISTLTAHGAMPVDIPDVSHQHILDRILARRKPISRDGKKGYQDALIWETLLSLKPLPADPLHFVSQNSSDFTDGVNRYRLADDLLEDLSSQFSDESVVRFFPTLKEFIDKCVKPAREIPFPGSEGGPLASGPEPTRRPLARPVHEVVEEFLEGYMNVEMDFTIDRMEDVVLEATPTYSRVEIARPEGKHVDQHQQRLWD